jgi:hypothetical protein
MKFDACSSRQQSNNHYPCRATCFKYCDGICRYRFPRPVEATTRLDAANALHVCRNADSTLLNAFNPTVLLTTRSNNDISAIVFSLLGPALAFYITKYISKAAAAQIAHDAGVSAACAVARRLQRSADITDVVRYASSVLLSLVSKSVSEVSAVAAVYAMINHVRIFSSSSLFLFFVFVFFSSSFIF